MILLCLFTSPPSTHTYLLAFTSLIANTSFSTLCTCLFVFCSKHKSINIFIPTKLGIFNEHKTFSHPCLRREDAERLTI